MGGILPEPVHQLPVFFVVELPFEVPESFAGWRTAAHGGLIATVLDEVMTWAAIVGSQKPCYAAEFKVRLLKPLPPGTACVAAARMTQDRKRLFLTEASLKDADGKTLFATAEGRYMAVPKEKMNEFRDDFVSDDTCLDLKDVLG